MILVTGGTGHIGNVLVRKLHEQYPSEPIRLFLQPGETLDFFAGLTISLSYGDIRNLADVRQAVRGARIVFHLAGIVDTAPRHPELLQSVNIGGTRNIVQACLQESVERLVYVSSVHALPDLPDDQEITEITDFPVPGLQGYYSRSKSEATAIVYDGIADGLDAVVLFPSGVIGPDDQRLSEMGRLFRYLSTQGWLKLVMTFDGAYDFVDVRDVADGILAAARNGLPGDGFILSGHRIALRDMIRLVRLVLGQKQPRIFFAPRWLIQSAAWLTDTLCRLLRIKPFFTPYSVSVLLSNSRLSHEKAARLLGYQPRPLIETFRDTIHWMQDNHLIKVRKSGTRFPRQSSVSKNL